MRKVLLSGAAATLAAVLVVPVAQSQQQVKSLRGAIQLDADSAQPAVKSWRADRPPIVREYVHQPPLIPHSIDGYKINKKFNKCLTCHSWANYRDTGAVKISHTHFSDRDGNDLANVSARRYFCTQCHVPQVDTEPLVENSFAPVEAIKGR